MLTHTSRRDRDWNVSLGGMKRKKVVGSGMDKAYVGTSFCLRTAMSRIQFFQSLLCPLYFFFLISFLALTEILLDENSQWFCILVCNFFTAKHYRSRSRWENLDRGQYPFQPIKFVNSVVPSPCETEPYNNRLLLTMDTYQLNLETCTFHEEIKLFIKW